MGTVDVGVSCGTGIRLGCHRKNHATLSRQAAQSGPERYRGIRMIDDEWFDGPPRDGWESGADEPTITASYSELTPVPFLCAACGEENETNLDLAGGLHQSYTEDCAVCCRPN